MSGGVDSSATAALLLEQGYEVIGITLKLWPQDCVNRAEDKCCGPQAVTDARAVCDKLDIPYYLIDEAAEFQKHVIQYFADEYKAGRTPNPCVMCNQNLKFGRLIDRADQLGADFIATGHFARIERGSEREFAPFENQSRFTSAATRYLLKRGQRSAQGSKLFSFFAAAGPACARDFSARRKKQERHARSGAALQSQDRRQGGEHGNLLRGGQQLRRVSPAANLVQKHRGDIVDLHGHVLGHHDGIEFYTIGQRKGLGITTPKPVYVVELDAEHNRVVVGDESALDRDDFTATNCNWHPFDKLTEPIEVTAKIRYNHPGTPATVTPTGNGSVKVKFMRRSAPSRPARRRCFIRTIWWLAAVGLRDNSHGALTARPSRCIVPAMKMLIPLAAVLIFQHDHGRHSPRD